ncbi:MAG: DMT family transporter, partial [Patescibacteria group bacterium]
QQKTDKTDSTETVTMDGVVFAWTLGATIIGGVQAFVQKVVANQGRNSALNGFLMYGLSAVAAFVTLVLFYEVPKELFEIVVFGLLGGVTHAIGNFIRIESLKSIDSVIYFPINKVLGPLIVIVGGIWWFGESLALREIIGITVSICVPLILVSSAEKHRQVNLHLGLILLVISTVLTSFGALLTKKGLAYDETLLCVMLLGQIAGAATSLIIFLREKHVRDGKNFGITLADLKLGAITGVFSFTGFWMLLKAMSMGQISIVYVIHAHYILVPIVLSIWWYREHINVRKVAAVGVSFLAIALLI